MAALIIGATSGPGAAIARAWPKEALWLAGSHREHLDALAGELQATAIHADVHAEAHVRRLFHAITLPLDTIVYVPGPVEPEMLSVASPGVTRATWNEGYFGALWTLKYGVRKMSGDGRAYFLHAQAADVSAPGLAQFAAAQAALGQLVRVARHEYPRVTLSLVSLAPDALLPESLTAGNVTPRASDEIASVIVRNRFDEAGAPELRRGG